MKVYLHEDAHKSIQRRLICNSPDRKIKTPDSNESTTMGYCHLDQPHNRVRGI